MRGEGGRYVGGVEGEELGTEFSEVDFLGVGTAIGVYQEAGILVGLGAGAERGVPSRSTMVRVKF